MASLTFPDYKPQTNLQWEANHNLYCGTSTASSLTLDDLKRSYERLSSPSINKMKGGEKQMTNLNDAQKRNLSQAQQDFYRNGWISSDLRISSYGRDAVLDFLFVKYEKELAKVASEKIAEYETKKHGICDECGDDY